MHLILSNYIKEGSEIRTDCWKGYNGLARIPGKGYRHETVNHAKEFKTAAGVHTNTIEGKVLHMITILLLYANNWSYDLGTWNGIKSIIKARHRTAPIMNYRLAEFIFRRKHAGDLWGGIIKALKEVSFDKVTSSDDIDEEFIYTEVKRERSDLDHDDSEFNGK